MTLDERIARIDTIGEKHMAMLDAEAVWMEERMKAIDASLDRLEYLCSWGLVWMGITTVLTYMLLQYLLR